MSIVTLFFILFGSFILTGKLINLLFHPKWMKNLKIFDQIPDKVTQSLLYITAITLGIYIIIKNV